MDVPARHAKAKVIEQTAKDVPVNVVDRAAGFKRLLPP
jgi:hypothetical protein